MLVGDWLDGTPWDVDLETRRAVQLFTTPGTNAVYAGTDKLFVSEPRSGRVHLYRYVPGAPPEHLDGMSGLYWGSAEGHAGAGEVVWTKPGNDPAQFFRITGDRLELVGLLHHEHAGGRCTVVVVDGAPHATVDYGNTLRRIELGSAETTRQVRLDPWIFRDVQEANQRLSEWSGSRTGGDLYPLFRRLIEMGFDPQLTQGPPISLFVWFSEYDQDVRIAAIPDGGIDDVMRAVLDALDGAFCASTISDVTEEEWPPFVRLTAALAFTPDDPQEFWEVMVEDWVDYIDDPVVKAQLPDADEVARLYDT